MFDRLDWFIRLQPSVPGCRPLVGRAWNQGLTAWLFLTQDTKGSASALANWYTMAFRPIFSGSGDQKQKHQLLCAIAQRIARTKMAPTRITLAPVPRADGTSDLIISAFRKAGWFALSRQSSTSWTVNVAGQRFDDYWAARPSQLRNTFRRKSKKSLVDVEVCTSVDEDSWAAYESVYADSWKPPEGAMSFLRETAFSESTAGCVRLGLARIDGQVVAAQFWTVENGIAYIHKLAHRESAKEHSPGTILSAAMFKHVIDTDRVETIDFGTGNDTYKADWMDSASPLDTILLFNKRHPVGWIGAAREKLSALVCKRRPN